PSNRDLWIEATAQMGKSLASAHVAFKSSESSVPKFIAIFYYFLQQVSNGRGSSAIATVHFHSPGRLLMGRG
ncbi:hypothetical protein A2U01_0018634, partial [Trifolium medium]|nr:hypothetical protein [Trifolium medium]